MKNCILAPILFLAGAVSAPALSQEALMKEAQGVFKPIPLTAPKIAGNPATADKIELGRMLYFDTRLSESHAISCNSCHVVGMGGVDEQEKSIGHHWQRGGRNAPTVLNAVFNVAQFWDGRASDLRAQAGGPMINPAEMASSETHVLKQLGGIPGYVAMFAKVYPGEKNPITMANVSKAIEVFEATLITPNAPFDRYLKGDVKALNDSQKAGLKLFMDKGCSGCHNGINVGGGMYQPFGVVEKPGADLLPPGDKGRFEVTKSVNDEYVFKVPSLRNIELTPPYFHTGRSWDLRQAVAVMGASQLGARLSPDEVDKIVIFLKSLTGDQPRVVYPILPPATVDTPRPPER